MSLLLDSDNPPRRGKLRQHLAERGADGREIAVQQHQRPTVAVYLVVHLQTVHGNIATLHGRARLILLGHEYLYPSAPPGSSMTPSRVINSETMTFLMGFVSLSYSIGCLRGSQGATVQDLIDPRCASVRSVEREQRQAQTTLCMRSEERRVGKECRYGVWAGR